ncbi:MAG: flagellar hook-length control protein FliK, partial [Rhodospirillaceae bacterium]|nr:flagellar hook-length control protein FliK [Rhodospirillaceae bacterium]
LQRGARDLTSALSDAGLQTDSQDLNFSLREQANQNAGNGNSGKDEQLDFNETENQSISSNDIDDPAALEAALRRSISEGRIDIRA